MKWLQAHKESVKFPKNPENNKKIQKIMHYSRNKSKNRVLLILKRSSLSIKTGGDVGNISDSEKLIHTEQGKKWLSQFDPMDQGTAISIADNLTLVSQTEFERNLLLKLERLASSIEGSVGFFAVRELKKASPFYSQVTSCNGQSVNALSSSSDQGSETRIAGIIRNLCLSNPEKYLNHPTLESLRKNKSDAIIFVDDLIGSGNRVHEFLNSFWLEKTIVSWLSGKQIKFHVVTYSGTRDGINYVERHKSKPQVHIYRDAPTFNSFPWSNEKKKRVEKLCREYGSRVNKRRKNMWYGYKGGMVAMIFEHGCPNNTPAILWGSDFKAGNWIGLFPNRTISSTVKSVFPPEIIRGDPIEVLMEVGQYRLAKSDSLLKREFSGQIILIILALIAKGKRKRSTVSFATGLNVEEYEHFIKKCIECSFITEQRRITLKGLAELNAARNLKIGQLISFDKGTDYYYPEQLREAARD